MEDSEESNMEDSERSMIDYIDNVIKSKIESMRNRVIWIPRMDGETTALLGTWKQLIVKALKRRDTFDYVIEITAQPPTEARSNKYTHTKEQMMIAEKLGILDEEDGALRRILESRDELDYYQYYLDDHDGVVEQRSLSPELATKIYNKLRDKKYLLVFEHLDRPIEQTLLTVEIGLPTPLQYNGCWWLISTLSDSICSASKSDADLVIDPYLVAAPRESGIHLLRVEAQHILSTISPLISGRDEDKILDCLFYSFMFTTGETRVQDDEYGGGITEDELVRFWMEEGFISEVTADTNTTSRIINQKQQQQQQQEEEDYDYNYSHLFNIGKAIMDKFITRSLLHRRHLFIINTTDAIRIFYYKTQIYYHPYMRKWWFWLYRTVVLPSYLGEWEEKKHISLFQLSLSGFSLASPPRCRELTTLILRGCSHMHNIPDDFFRHMPLLRILDLSYTDLTFLPSSVSYLLQLRLLTLRGCQKLTNLLPSCSQFSSSSSSASLRSSPPQHHPLLNLHVLDVSCTNITSLSTTLHVPNLTDFFLDGCTALLDPPPFLPSLNKLRVLCLTGTQITTFPDSTFSCMEWLRVLDLSNNHHLVSLPRSLSKARLLEELHITYCRSSMKIDAVDGAKLKIFSLLGSDNLTSLPEWLSRAKNLEKLHLQNCRAMEKINIAGNACNLRSFFLSGAPIVELSLRGCKNLETVELHDLEELEVLDLSFTRINELRANIFNGLPKLRYFCMLAAKNLRRFPWHQIQHLPKEFILDHCSCRGISNNTHDVEELINGQTSIRRRRRLDVRGDDDKARAHIFVDDPRFFWSLKEEDCRRLLGDQVRRQHPILEFHVTIVPCERRCNKEEEASEALDSCRFMERRDLNPYKDIYIKRRELTKREEEQRRPSARLCRHLTMEGVEARWLPTGGCFHLPDNMDSLSISEDRSVVSLSHMSPMKALKECILTQCHNMEYVVVSNSKIQQTLLEILWVSGLGKLTTLFLVAKVGFVPSEFGRLKHVHIEHCPRLEKLFPNNEEGGDLLLPSLETLTIKFCDSLREITYRDDYHANYESVVYPRLHTLILLELPKLVHFREYHLRDAKLPSLKRLHVRGCWRLRRLPLPLLGDDIQSNVDLPRVVEVSGEQKWWNQLTWDHYHDEYGNLSFNDCFLVRFKPQAKFSTWEPTIRGRSRKKTSKQRLRTTTTMTH